MPAAAGGRVAAVAMVVPGGTVRRAGGSMFGAVPLFVADCRLWDSGSILRTLAVVAVFPDNIVVRAAAVLSAAGAPVVVPVAGLPAVQAVVAVVT